MVKGNQGYSAIEITVIRASAAQIYSVTRVKLWSTWRRVIGS